MVARLARLLLLLGLLAAGGFALFLAGRPPLPKTLPRAEGAAVLTGAAGRTMLGFTLLAAGHVQHLLISGVHPGTTLSDLVREARIEAPEAGAVELGHAARSTRGNAREISTWAATNRIGSVAVVTSQSHMRRALLELHRAAPELSLVACPVADPQGSALLRRALPEYAKYLAALLGVTALLQPYESA